MTATPRDLLAEAREEVRRIIEGLESIRWRLLGVKLSLPEPVEETVRLQEVADEMDPAAELRTGDSLRPRLLAASGHPGSPGCCQLAEWEEGIMKPLLPPLPTFNSGGARVDVSDRDALYEAMEGVSPLSEQYELAIEVEGRFEFPPGVQEALGKPPPEAFRGRVAPHQAISSVRRSVRLK